MDLELNFNTKKDSKWVPLPIKPYNKTVSLLIQQVGADEMKLVSKRWKVTKKVRGMSYQVDDEDKKQEESMRLLQDCVKGWKGIIDAESKQPVEFSKENWATFLDKMGGSMVYEFDDDGEYVKTNKSFLVWLSEASSAPETFHGTTENLPNT